MLRNDLYAAVSVPPARVLVIDDEAQIRKFLEISLRAEGYRVMLAADGETGLAMLASQGADLVVLDIGLPDRDGHVVLNEIRQWSSVPVIMLTVRNGEAEKVAALDGGANDYVTKPFSVQELMARIRGLLRVRAGTSEDALPLYDDGHLHIDLVQREVTMAGEVVSLTRKEFALLSLLMQHAGRVITQPQLISQLWGAEHSADTHYLRILVGKLRHKLGDDAATPRYIATEPGVGLRFVADQKFLRHSGRP